MIKKKYLDQDDKRAWEEYIKNPSDIYDKDKNYFKENQKPKVKKKKKLFYVMVFLI